MKHIPVVMSGEGMVVGIVRSRFNESVGLAMLEACSARLIELGVDTDDIVVASVPGALEVPLALQQMAATDEFDALIAIGAVIRGETYHFELVSNESGAGITRVGLDFGAPNVALVTRVRWYASFQSKTAFKNGVWQGTTLPVA